MFTFLTSQSVVQRAACYTLANILAASVINMQNTHHSSHASKLNAAVRWIVFMLMVGINFGRLCRFLRTADLHFEAVRCVRPQFADLHTVDLQPPAARGERHAVVTWLARPPLAAVAAAAEDIVDQVAAVTCVTWRLPLQDHRCFVDDRDDVAGCRGDAWRERVGGESEKEVGRCDAMYFN